MNYLVFTNSSEIISSLNAGAITMVINDLHGTTFQLKILGYQSPNVPIDSNRWDLNWLMIGISIQTPSSRLEFSDPALLTWEVQRLIEWMESIGRGVALESEFWSLEGVISFTFTLAQNQVDRVYLTVAIPLVENRVWIPVHYPLIWTEIMSKTRLVLTSHELIKASQELAADLSRYPMRK